MAAYAAYEAWNDPNGFAGSRRRNPADEARPRLWYYYKEYSRLVYTEEFIRARGLYRHTRLVYSPVRTIVDFYVDNVFEASGEAVDEQDAKLIAVTALADGAEEAVKIAVAQLEQWGNWQSEASNLVRFSACAGSMLVKATDELEREKVTEQMFWPSAVKELELDAAGNVKRYRLEYKVYDPVQKADYTYGEECDGDAFRYFKDGRPFDYGEGAVKDNPYGFVPAVWVKHEDDGWDAGSPAVSDTTKIDEVNSITSHARDHGHKAIEAGKMISTSGSIMAVTGASGASEAGRPGGLSTAGYDPRFDWQLLKAPQDSAIHDLGSSYDLGQIDPEIKRELDSFERDYPELQVHDIIKNKSQIAGVALERMLAPAQKKLDRAAARYHHQIVKLRQMQIAIAGWRTSNGWTKRDRQQQRFGDFGLDSYASGDLDFGFKRSQLIQQTPLEEEELKAKKMERAKSAEGLVDELERLLIAGYSEEEAKKIMARKAEATPETPPNQDDRSNGGAEVVE